MKKLLLGTLSLVMASTGTLSADPASVHGMLLFGQEKIYLSHLPMFHSPHDYQVIFEVELEPAAKAAYLDHQVQSPETPFYTLVPERLVLPEMVASPKPFSAEIFSGHFERPGHESLVEDSTVNITKVIYFAKLKAKTPAPAKLTYLAFGTPTETFLAHFITGKPDFDHVLQVNLHGLAAVTTEPVKIEFNASNKNPLKSDTSEAVEIIKDLYLEFGDLSH